MYSAIYKSKEDKSKCLNYIRLPSVPDKVNGQVVIERMVASMKHLSGRNGVSSEANNK